jgi:iron complex outermembrane recepter protein
VNQEHMPVAFHDQKFVQNRWVATLLRLQLAVLGAGTPTITWADGSDTAQAQPQAGSLQASPESSAATMGTTPTVGGGELNEIVVTAQKRAQSINSVGMAITALTGDQLKAQGITDVASLTKADPSFAIAQGNWGGVVYQIRGVGYNDFSLAASPAVSVYSDEVPYAYPDMSKGATFDIERVEVLKGPQGTLYGQNATGGAVNYIAAKPTDTFQAGVEGTYARFNAVNFNGYVSGPLSETLKARLSFDVDQGGAWQKGYTRDDVLGNKDTNKGRLLLDWTPTDRLKLFVNINGWTDNSQTQAGQLRGLFLGHAGDAIDIPSLINAPVAPQNAQAADWLAGTHPANDESYYQGSVRAEYTVSDRLLLTYLGSYENYHQNDLTEPDGANNQLSLLQGGSVDSNSQELRVSGDLFDSRVIWLLGGEYARAITDEDQFEDVFGTTSAFSLASLNNGVPFQSFNNMSTDDSVSKAVFGNLEYHPIAQLGLHAGVRYTKTDITHGGCSKDDGDGLFASSLTAYETHLLKGVGVIPAVPGGCATLDTIDTSNLYHPVYTDRTLDESNVSWRVGADWTPIEKTLLYASVSKGYKAGSFPTLAATFSSSLLPVKQESLLAYETGIKSRFFDNRVELDADVFYYDYDNKQLEMRELEGVFGLLNTLVNIPKSSETGAELALKYLPTSHLALSFRATYLDSKVTETYMGYNPFSTTPINLKGEPFPNTPRWAIGGDAQYNWDINDRYSAFVGIDGRYQTQSQGEFGAYQAIAAGYVNTPSPLQPTTPPVQAGSIVMVNDAYGIVDLRAGILSNDSHWHLQVFADNVTNTYYWNQARLAGDAVVRFAGMPRTYGVTVGYRY